MALNQKNFKIHARAGDSFFFLSLQEMVLAQCRHVGPYFVCNILLSKTMNKIHLLLGNIVIDSAVLPYIRNETERKI